MNKYRCECIHMWTIIAEEDCDKHDALLIMGYNWAEMPENGCFACEECSEECSKCPVTWLTEEYNGCYEKESPYDKWVLSETPTDRMKHAREVLHLIETTWKDD